MAVKSVVVSVGTTATLIEDGTLGEAAAPVSVVASVPSGGVTVYFGGADVTTANGYPVAGGVQSPAMDLFGGDQLYAVVASGTQNVNVLKTRA